MRRFNRPVLAAALLAAYSVACQDSTTSEPFELPPAIPNATGAVGYLAEKTVTRESGAAQTLEFTLDEREYGAFMEPFVLHVQAGGTRAVRGRVLVDGLPVLDQQHLTAMGTDPYSIEVPVTAASTIGVELEGEAGGTLTFRVDAPVQPAPVITINSFPRHTVGAGAFFEFGTLDPSSVSVNGTACHPRFPITELEVSGLPVTVSGTNLCEPFSVPQQSRWGMTVITARARNARGREGTAVQAFTRSPEHYEIPVANQLSTSVRGLFNHLTQAALDDGSRADLDDLATFLKQVIDDPIVIPASTPVACNDVFEVRMPQQTFTPAIVINSLTANATHVTVDITITSPSIALSVRADPLQPFDDNCEGTLVENATFSATSIRITGGLRLTAPPGAIGPDVALENPSVVVTGASASSTSAAADALISGLTSVAAAVLNSFIGQFVLDLLTPTFADLLAGFVPSLNRDVMLNGATVHVASGFATVANGGAPDPFVRMGGYGLIAPVTSLAGAVAPRGPIRALCGSTPNPCAGGVNTQPPMPPFNVGANTFAIAVHQDMLNHAMWSAWRAGVFTLTQPSLTLSATMPPVSMSKDAADPMGEVRWGDVRVTATFDPAELGEPAGAPIVVDAWVSASVRGDVQFTTPARVLVLANVATTIDVELTGPPLPYDNALLRAAIVNKVRAPLLAFTSNGFAAIPIPSTSPSLANGSVTRSGLFYILAGTLQ